MRIGNERIGDKKACFCVTAVETWVSALRGWILVSVCVSDCPANQPTNQPVLLRYSNNHYVTVSLRVISTKMPSKPALYKVFQKPFPVAYNFKLISEHSSGDTPLM
jgi:hypothetical protein